MKINKQIKAMNTKITYI